MYPRGQHPLYPYTEEDRRVVLETLGLTESKLEADVDSIQTWIQKQPHLAEAGIESSVAEIFLLMAKGSVEKVKQRIDCYYKGRANLPEISDRIKLLESGAPIFDTHVMPSAPKLFKGSRISFMRVFDWDKATVEEVARNVFMISDLRYVHDFVSSEIWVVDFEYATMGHILRLNLMSLARSCWLLQQGLGIRMQSIYIINCSMANIVQAVMNICRPVVSKKVLDRIKVLNTAEDLKKYIPSEYLPKDYGGDLPSYASYKEKLEAIYTSEKTKQFLIERCKLVSDESKRPKTEYDEECLQGNFRKLEVD